MPVTIESAVIKSDGTGKSTFQLVLSLTIKYGYKAICCSKVPQIHRLELRKV